MHKIISLFFLASTIACSKATVHQTSYINPTGTYQFGTEAPQEGNDIHGYTGRIQVKALAADRIVMTFGIQKGAPGYNSGSFVDTLDYKNNRSVYQPDTGLDSDCTVTFDFTGKHAAVTEESDNATACGFGHGVAAGGVFNKTASGKPLLTHPLTGEMIK